MNTFVQDQSRVAIFYNKNVEKIKTILGQRAKNIEYENDEVWKMFDKYSNIDFIALANDLVYGISARVNFTKHTQEHVTIRYKRSNGSETEYEKALRVYNSASYTNPITSSWHVQMDSDEDMNIKRAIVVNKKQLIEHIEDNKDFFEKEYMNTVQADGNKFFKIPYKYFQEEQVKVIYKYHSFNND